MYIYYDANPSGSPTGDCVIRAIATITRRPWRDIHNLGGRMPMYSSQGRDSMGRYSSTMDNGYSQGYSRDEANHKMRTDLEMKLASASNEEERKAIMKCLRALDN